MGSIIFTTRGDSKMKLMASLKRWWRLANQQENVSEAFHLWEQLKFYMLKKMELFNRFIGYGKIKGWIDMTPKYRA